jgi:hypothetical protein
MFNVSLPVGRSYMPEVTQWHRDAAVACGSKVLHLFFTEDFRLAG